MTRTELSQCLTDIPTKYLTAQERDYMLAKMQSEKLEMIKNIVSDPHNSFEVKIIKLKGILND